MLTLTGETWASEMALSVKGLADQACGADVEPQNLQWKGMDGSGKLSSDRHTHAMARMHLQPTLTHMPWHTCT